MHSSQGENDKLQKTFVLAWFAAKFPRLQEKVGILLKVIVLLTVPLGGQWGNTFLTCKGHFWGSGDGAQIECLPHVQKTLDSNLSLAETSIGTGHPQLQPLGGSVLSYIKSLRSAWAKLCPSYPLHWTAMGHACVSGVLNALQDNVSPSASLVLQSCRGLDLLTSTQESTSLVLEISVSFIQICQEALGAW